MTNLWGVNKNNKTTMVIFYIPAVKYRNLGEIIIIYDIKVQNYHKLCFQGNQPLCLYNYFYNRADVKIRYSNKIGLTAFLLMS